MASVSASGSTRRIPVVVATAEAGDLPTPGSRHLALLIRRIQERDVDPTVLMWNANRVVEELASETPIAGPPMMGRSAVVTMLRSVRLRRLASRVKGLLLRRWFAQRRRTPIVLAGAACESILPWLGHHEAPVVWLLVNGEVDHLGVDGPAGVRSVDRVLVSSAEEARAVATRGVDPSRIEVVGLHHPLGMRAVPDPATAPVGVIGELRDAHGADMVPRFLWWLNRCTGRAVSLRWAAIGQAELPAMVRHDLRNLGLTDLVEVAPAPEDWAGWLESVALVVLPWRESIDADLSVSISAAGRVCLSFAVDPAHAGATTVRFPSVESLAAAAAEQLGDRKRLVARSGAIARHSDAETGTTRLVQLLLGSAG